MTPTDRRAALPDAAGARPDLNQPLSQGVESIAEFQRRQLDGLMMTALRLVTAAAACRVEVCQAGRLIRRRGAIATRALLRVDRPSRVSADGKILRLDIGQAY